MTEPKTGINHSSNICFNQQLMCPLLNVSMTSWRYSRSFL